MSSLGLFVSTLQPYVIGRIFGVIGTFATGFSKEFFEERARVAKHRREVARHVLRICNEASTGNFKQAPREIGDVHAALTDLAGGQIE